MKKIFILLLCVCILMQLCACAKSEQVAEMPENETVKQSEVKIDELAEAAKNDNVDIAQSREAVKELKDDMNKLGDEIKESGATEAEKTKYENQQLAVAIMEMAVNDLEKARQANDEAAEKEALSNMELAQSIWNWEGNME